MVLAGGTETIGAEIVLTLAIARKTQALLSCIAHGIVRNFDNRGSSQ